MVFNLNNLHFIMASLSLNPQSLFHLFGGTVKGQCMGGCKQMITADDKDHSFCNRCWDSIFAPKTSPKKVTFKDDNVECLMKPPCQTKIFDQLAPASDVSSNVCAEVKPIERKKNAWVPAHLR